MKPVVNKRPFHDPFCLSTPRCRDQKNWKTAAKKTQRIRLLDATSLRYALLEVTLAPPVSSSVVER
jgi:hypothetical protein